MNIPVSTSIVPRPVWARWLRRQEFGVLGYPPTDAEKHDAILVLRDYADDDGPRMSLVREAQRIMDEASAA